MSTSSFFQNGLLVPAVASDAASTSTSSRFLSKSNGLLNSSEIHAEPVSEHTRTEESSHTFKLTSLLSSTNTIIHSHGIVQDTVKYDDMKSTTMKNRLITGQGSASRNTSPTLEHAPIHLELSQDSPSSDLTQPDCIRATTFGGKTTYLRKKCKQNGSSTTADSTASSPFSNLLETPIHRLLDDLAAQAARRLQHEPMQRIQSNDDTYSDDTLWVDRYRPTRFTDLIGNDRIAREAMGWLKQWDYCVFGKKTGKKRHWDGQEKFKSEDEYHRPREKILLMSGPPGLGKTTLAHVIARQAGYEVMEINASDARAGHIVEERIRPALETGHAVNSAKPVLLVIDEIDGATGAGENANSFIQNLIQLTQHKAKKKRRPGQKQQFSAHRPLLRPIICICNDINASSLSKLRAHAYQLRFTRPPDFYTVRRLQEICGTEGLQADTRALNTLVAVTKGDFRGCLNTLQFIRSKSENVTEGVVRRATAGMKEGDTTILTILNNIFNPLTRKRVKELGLTEAQESKYVGRLSHEIDASGKDSAIANGCFEHYVTLRHHDANFWRYERANEWLITHDLLSASMYADGEFALLPYLPYTLAPFYPLFQTRGSRVERNYFDWEHLQLTKVNESIYGSFARCLRSATVRQQGGAYRHLISHPTLELEFTPYINRIISPPLKPVNSQIIRSEERQTLSRLVDIMTTLELRFVHDRGEDGQLSYRLEPPIDVFATYDGKRATDIAPSRYAVRHLVATEIDARLATQDFDTIEKGKRNKFPAKTALSSENRSEEFESESSGPIQKRKKLDELDRMEKAATDFFGRPIVVAADVNTKLTAKKQKDKTHHVSYKFNEGNSAAVRKPVKLEAFL